MPDRKARVAVIGAGWWSTYTHIPYLSHHPEAELVAICDRSEAALAKATAAYGLLKTYADHRRMLAEERLDGVVVAVKHAAHYPVTRDCLETGLHVLLEKPMTIKATDAHALAQLARQKRRELIIGYPWHYTSTTIKAREVMQSGTLGHVQYKSCLFAAPVIEFFRANDQAYQPIFQYPVTGPGNVYADPKVSGGGQGYLQVTHSAAAMFWISGLQPDRVSAFMENWDVPVDLVDAITVRCKPANGHAAVAVLGSTGNMCALCGTHFEAWIYCENGHIVVDEATGTLFVRNHNGDEETFGPLPANETYPRFAPPHNLVDIILGRGTNLSPASIGVTVVEMLDAAYRSNIDLGNRALHVLDLGNRAILTQAIAAVDNALWDALGKLYNVPLYKLLGGYREKVPVIAIGGYYEGKSGSDPLKAELDSYREWQLAGIKFKVGRVSVTEDLKRVERMRAVAGDDFIIACDANQAWTPQQAIEFCRAAAGLTIRWIEEPVRWYEQLEGLRLVRENSPIPVTAGQGEISRFGVRYLIIHGGVNILNVDVTVAGGVTEWRRMAALASHFHVEMAHHEESQISLHLLASIPHGLCVEIFPNPKRDPLWFELPLERPRIRNGFMELPSGPGLGMDLNEDVIARYRTD